jgi:hypothetical protein
VVHRRSGKRAAKRDAAIVLRPGTEGKRSEPRTFRAHPSPSNFVRTN